MAGSAQTDATKWLLRHSGKITEHDTLEVSEQVASTTKVEAWLQQRGVKYAPATTIPLTMIDERRSRANQARKDALVTESVERFATSFRAGNSFPPIVVYPLASRLVIIDGNNRHEAAKRARLESIWGIIIDAETDGDMIQLLTVEANASHGVTPPLEWRIRQAMHLMLLGHPEPLAAEASGVTALQVKSYKAAQEADARAKVLRVSGFGELSTSTKVAMNAVRSEPVFHAIAVLAASHKLGVEAVREITREVRKARSEAEMLAVVADFVSNFDVENALKKAMKRGPSSPKNAVASACGLLDKCDPDALVAQILTPHDRDVINNRLDKTVEKILQIQIAMERLNNLGVE